MVMSLLRLALAVRDADGDTVVAEEVLDQIALPLKTSVSVVAVLLGGGPPGSVPVTAV